MLILVVAFQDQCNDNREFCWLRIHLGRLADGVDAVERYAQMGVDHP